MKNEELYIYALVVKYRGKDNKQYTYLSIVFARNTDEAFYKAVEKLKKDEKSYISGSAELWLYTYIDLDKVKNKIENVESSSNFNNGLKQFD